MTTMTNVQRKRLQARLLSLLPDSAMRLVSRGVIGIRVRNMGPTHAWTTWDEEKGRFEVNFLAPTVGEMRDEMLRFLWYHELGHVALGHFSPGEKCRRADWLMAADVCVNWALRDRKELIHELNGIDAEEWLPQLGLGQRTYPLFVVHDILHQKQDEHMQSCPACNGEGEPQEGGDHQPGEGNSCGGVEEVDDPRALANGITVSRTLGEDQSSDNWMRGIGSGAGNLDIRLTEYPLPKWVQAVERFARSMVEMQLTERRTHKRANPTLRSAGVHVPTHRPAWAPVPSVLCLLVDTSGSMLDELKYVAPVLAYLKEHGITTRLIAGDTRVTFDEVVESIPEHIPGAGGTDILPLFERAHEYEPKGLVCFTDGYVPAWPRDDGIPTLWVGVHGEVPYGEQA